MNGEPRDEMLVGYLELDLPEAERDALDRLLASDPALAAQLEELRTVDRSLFETSEAAWRRSGLGAVRIDARRLIAAERSPDELALTVGPLRVLEREHRAATPSGPQVVRRRPPMLTALRSLPVAAALSLVCLGGAIILWQQRDSIRQLASPRVAASVAQGAGDFALGTQVMTRTRYAAPDGAVACLLLAERSNASMFVGGPASLEASSPTRFRFDGNALFVVLPVSDKQLTIEVGDTALIETEACVFEVKGNILRVKSGHLRVESLTGGARRELVGAQEVTLDDPELVPRILDAKEQSRIGTWTGEIASPGSTPAPNAGKESEQSTATESTEHPASTLLALLPGNALGAILMIPGEDSKTVPGPSAAALLPQTALPFVATISSEPMQAAQALQDIIGPSLSASSSWTTEPDGVPRLRLAQRRRPNSAGPGEAADLIVLPNGALLMPERTVTESTSARHGVALRDSPLGARLLSEAAAAPSGAVVFTVDVAHLLRRNGAGDGTVPLLGLDPASALLSGTAVVRDGVVHISATLPLDPSLTPGTEEPAGPAPSSMLADLPAGDSAAFALRTSGGGALLALWHQLLTSEAYQGDSARLEAQLGAFEDANGLRVATIAAQLDGTIAGAYYPAAAPGGAFVAFAGIRSGALAQAQLLAETATALVRSASSDMAPGTPSFTDGIQWAVLGQRLVVAGIDPAVLGASGGARKATPGTEPASGIEFAAARLALANSGALTASLAIDPATRAVNLEATLPSDREALEALLSAVGLPATFDNRIRREVKAFERRLDELEQAIGRFGQRFGRPPRALAELSEAGLWQFPVSDPFNKYGGALSYEVDLRHGTWTLWSIGPDSRNDRGVIDWTEEKSIADPGDLVRRGAVRSESQ